MRAEVLDTEGLRDGTYDLQVEAFDGSSRQYFQTRRPIFIRGSCPIRTGGGSFSLIAAGRVGVRRLWICHCGGRVRRCPRVCCRRMIG